jgi:hypothetical protein
MPDSPTVVLGIGDTRTRAWIEKIVRGAGYPVVVKDGPQALDDLAPDGTVYFVIAETGTDGLALDALYTRLKQQFRGHWDQIVVLGVLLRPMGEDRWWGKWWADEEFLAITNIASRDWKDWKYAIPCLLQRIQESRQ